MAIFVALYVHVKYCYLINLDDKRFHILKTKTHYNLSLTMTFNNLTNNTIAATLIKTVEKLQITTFSQKQSKWQ